MGLTKMSYRKAITVQFTGTSNVPTIIYTDAVDYKTQLINAKALINSIASGSGGTQVVSVEVWENVSTKKYIVNPGSGVVKTRTR